MNLTYRDNFIKEIKKLIKLSNIHSDQIDDLQDQIDDLVPGGGGGSSTITEDYVAGETINGGKAVMIDIDNKAYIFDINDPTNYDKYVGIAKTSTVSGDDVRVILSGIDDTVGSGYEPGQQYFIASNGSLTSVPPVSGLVKQVAIGVNSTTLLIESGIEFEQ